MAPSQAEWTSSLSVATTIDTVSADDRTGSDSTHSVGRSRLSSFPSPPPRRLVRSDASFIEKTSPTLSVHHHNIRVPRPVYLSMNHEDALPQRSTLARAHTRRSIGRGKAPTRELEPVGGAAESVSEPLEQLRQSSYEPQHQDLLGDARAGLSIRKSPSTDLPHLPKATRTERHGRSSWQRPHVHPGLPTSYSHDLHHSQPASPSSVTQSLPTLPQALHIDSASSSSAPTLTHRRSSIGTAQGVDRHRSLPVLSGSPALHFDALRDHPCPRQTLGSFTSISKRPSLSSLYTPSRTNYLREGSSSDHSLSYGHSRGPSIASSAQTHPTSTEGSRPPSAFGTYAPASTSVGSRSRSRSGLDNVDKVRFDTNPISTQSSQRVHMSRSQPIVSNTPASANPAEPRDQSGIHNNIQRPNRETGPSLVTTELVSGARYLEPYNSCEAIMFPRPRLRSRSLGTAPAIVVERIHAAPERFWQRETGPHETARMQLAPRSSVATWANESRSRVRSQSDAPYSVNAAGKDRRLVLHEAIAPPLPPKDSALPSSGLLPSKPLPPTPSSAPSPAATPFVDQRRESADSLENLEASELLERNRQLEKDRQAWREEYKSSIGASGIPFRDRLSPCLRDPSDDRVLGSFGKGRAEGTLSDSDHETYASPIRVHRVWNEDGTEQTFLIVRRRDKHPYTHRRMSVSSPDLRGGSSASTQRSPLVRNLTSRLAGLAGKGRARKPYDPHLQQKPLSQDTSASKPNLSAVSHPTMGRRPFGKDRKLVSDETVIIGKVPEPLQHSETGFRQGVAWSPEPQRGRAVSLTRREPLSGYRPVGTPDEIKAQLGERTDLFFEPRSKIHWRAGQDTGTVSDRLTWIDPGSNTVMQGELIMSGDSHPRLRSDTRGREAMLAQLPWTPADRQDMSRQTRPVDLPSSVSTGCTDSDRSCQSGERGSPPTAPPTRDVSATNTSPGQLGQRSYVHAAPRASVLSMENERVGTMEQSTTGDSSISSDTHRDLAVWDASSENLDNLFFRPPPRRQAYS